MFGTGALQRAHNLAANALLVFRFSDALALTPTVMVGSQLSLTKQRDFSVSSVEAFRTVSRVHSESPREDTVRAHLITTRQLQVDLSMMHLHGSLPSPGVHVTLHVGDSPLRPVRSHVHHRHCDSFSTNSRRVRVLKYACN